MNLHPEKDLTRVKADVFWGELAASEHVVQVYEQEEIFLNTLTGFTGAGINAGKAVIVIATEAHLTALVKRLRSYGLHMGSLLAEGLYIPVDAHEMLSRFMVNGLPDEQLFRKAVDYVLERTHRRYGQFRAFGEMVALLWAEGNHEGALELEKCWNRLLAEKKFTLFCAYPANIFREEAGDEIKQVCCVHSLQIDGSFNSVSTVAYRRLQHSA